jgi:signal transduction histidine kinase
VDLLDEQKEDLEEFITRDPRGQKLRDSITSIKTNLHKQLDGIGKESGNLSNYLEGMRSILQFQQQFVKENKAIEPVSINQVLRNIIAESSISLEEHSIEVYEDFAPLPPLPIDHLKFSRIVHCLLQNARESIAANDSPGKIWMKTQVTEDSALVMVKDNGVGLSEGNDRNLFTQGFTTKKQGKGMGLHYSANAMYEMGGNIGIKSDGPGSGAVVTLSFPLGPRMYKPNGEKTATGLANS